MAAENGQTGDHVVPRLHVAHFRAYGFDDAGGLVSENGRGRTGVEALLEVQVAMATPAAASSYADLVCPRGTYAHLFNGQGLMRYERLQLSLVHPPQDGKVI